MSDIPLGKGVCVRTEQSVRIQRLRCGHVGVLTAETLSHRDDQDPVGGYEMARFFRGQTRQLANLKISLLGLLLATLSSYANGDSTNAPF